MKQKAALLREKSIIGSLVSLSLPIIAANLLQSAYQLTDTFWVGRLGGDAVAAVSVSFPILFLMIAVGAGVAIAGSILIAHYAGAGEQHMITHVSAQTLLMIVLISLVLSAVGYALTPSALRVMGVAPNVLPDAVSYLRISFFGVLFLFVYFSFQSIMRGVGETRLPFYIVLLTVLLNLVLDPLLIFGWGPVPALGVGGAAWSTVITQGIAAGAGLYLLSGKRHGVHLRGARWRPDFALIRTMVHLSIPASIEQTARALGMTAILVLVASFGTSALAAYGIGIRLLSFIIVPAMGLSMATSTLVGHNIGAGDPARAIAVARLSVVVSFAGLCVCGALMYFFAEPLVRFFVPDDPQLVREGAQFVRIVAPFFGFIGVQLALIGVFRGAGDMITAMTLALVAVWVFQVPIAYLLSRDAALGMIGIWWALPAADLLAGSLAAVVFMRSSWHDRRLTETQMSEQEVFAEILIEEGIQK